jgi:hypothetical protein
MRFVLFVYLLIIQSLLFSQTRKKGEWQVIFFQGSSYATPPINQILGGTLYSSIGDLPQASFSIGLGKTQRWKKGFLLEYNLNWQKFGYKINYFPIDTSSMFLYQVSQEYKFHFLKLSGSIVKEYYFNKRIFVTAGLGFALCYAMSIKTLNIDARYNPYKTNSFTIDELGGGRSHYNMDWHGFIGIGKNVFEKDKISLRISLQQLFTSNYEYTRNLNARGFCVVYTFGTML